MIHSRNSRSSGFAAVAGLLVLVLFTIVPAFAATTWTVTSTGDNIADPTTLRGAIAAAASGDTIDFSLTLPATISLTSGALAINKDLTISGPSAASLAISGPGSSVFAPVFLIGVTVQGLEVHISGVTINNGYGGCRWGGGGICNFRSKLTLANSTISGNLASNGGGITNQEGTLTLVNSTVSGNSTYRNEGGGIYNSSGTVTLSNSTVSGNSAYDGGGGIYNSNGPVTLSNSTVSGNSAGYGGGIVNVGEGTVTLSNSTVSGNSADTLGGGIYNANTALVTLTNSTLAGNSATSGGGIYNGSNVNAPVTLKNTIVANSLSGDNCAGVYGRPWSLGHNLSDDTSCTFLLPPPGDIINPLGGAGLDPAGLQDNGGPTQTIALLPTSPARDAVPTGDLADPTNYCTAVDRTTAIATDQRGVPRPQGTACEIGAYELDLIITRVNGPLDAQAVGTLVTISADFTDPNTAHTHICTISWGDGEPDSVFPALPEPAPSAEGLCEGSHIYADAGVYTVEVTVTDDSGAGDSELFQFVVIYDPSAGFVTGGGWINSPARASAAFPDAVGKANFGFVSKYLRGATVPTGNTEFQFKAGNLNFKSTSYDWLVVAGARAQYKGTGAINGAGNYGFMLTAIDGALPGGGGVDKFRIKIWDKNNGDAIVYDNQVGASDSEDPTTALGGGSIVIHTR